MQEPGNSISGPGGQLDPVERYVPLLLKLGVYAALGLVLYQAATCFAAFVPGRPWPLLLTVLRTFIFLPLHEGGHVLFIFFGRTLYTLGGSFWQIMFPLLWFLIALRQGSHVAPFALFWTGENMLDVSLYIRDAPVRHLPLLGGHRSGHDWYNLLSQWNIIDSADSIADLMYYGGLIICLGAIAAGVILAFRSFLLPPQPIPAIISKDPGRSQGPTRRSAGPDANRFPADRSQWAP